MQPVIKSNIKIYISPIIYMGLWSPQKTLQPFTCKRECVILLGKCYVEDQRHLSSFSIVEEVTV